MHQHRSGTLKQKNKAHRGVNGGHSSKRSIKRAQGGKVNAPGSSGASVQSSSGSKYQRLLRAKQARKQQRAQQWVERRTGTKQGAPLTVLILPISPCANSYQLLSEFLGAADKTSHDAPPAAAAPVVAVYQTLKTRMQFITIPSHDMDPLSVLEHSRPADVIVPLLSAAQGPDQTVDEGALQVISLLRAQGMPAVVGSLRDVGGLKAKQVTDLSRRATKFLSDEFGQHSKLVVENGAKTKPVETLLRTISSIGRRVLAWREIRPYLLAQQISMDPSRPNAAEDCGFAISGYLRGAPLHVHQLVHLPDIGPRRILRITTTVDPCSMKESYQHTGDEVLAENLEGAGEPLRLDAEPDSLFGEQTWPTEQEISDAQAQADEFATKLPPGTSDYQAAWLGPEDLVNEDEEEEEELGMGMDETGMVDLGSDTGALVMRSLQQGAKTKANMFAFLETSSKKSAAMSEMDDGDDNFSTLDDVYMTPEEMERERKMKKLERAAEEFEFPDEVDTPYDRPARERFARYRNLQSFRTSPWDPKESLPRYYSRLYDFGDFRVTQRRVLWDTEKAKSSERRLVIQTSAPSSVASASGIGSKASRASFASTITDTDSMDDVPVKSGASVGAMPPPMTLAALERTVRGAGEDMAEEVDDDSFDPRGWVTTGNFVRIEFAGVGAEVASRLIEKAATSPCTISALHRHENRLSLLNFSVQRAQELFLDPEDAVQSKDPMWAVCGFRRWLCRPMFSEQNLNADKHKFLRFLPPSTFVVASCYGPATFSPAPIILFRANSQPESSQPSLGTMVATGSLGSVDVDRIVLKKIVLTGYPVRVHKRTAVIKHMFYDPADIAWFKPVELTTKMGLSGHIKCPIGTHGLFKVHFGRVIKGHDTVCMNLYKRVYPKFIDEAGDGEMDEPKEVTLRVL